MVIFIDLINTQKAIAAPENFSPELTSSSDTEVNFESTSRSSTQVDEADKTTVEFVSEVNPQTSRPDTSASVPQIPLPSHTLPSESSRRSGTADIELETQPDSDKTPNSSTSTLKVDSLTFDYQLDFDNFGQTNPLIGEKIAFNLYGQSFVLQTGNNSFEQDEIETVDNIPLYLSWETKLKNINLTLTGGVDFFDRLANVPTVTLKASSPLFSSVTVDGKLKSLFVLSGQAQYQAYKFNAETLENEIDFWRFTPSIYWQIRPNLSLFTLGQYGIFNDGNREFQSFSRLEQKVGSFSLAANLFTWSFEQDLGSENGYFSPPDFLVYNAELAWQGKMFDEILDCKLSLAFGKQSVNGATDNAWTYKALCGAQLLANVKIDVGYTYSNVQDRITGDTSFSNQSIKSQLQIEL
ncbi:MAG: hypothetical protein QNJ53_17545 [Pleurocapsa sp. MO_192.B19]|nr:hypothetical protein [Pleurocapsa sp. MO_192.B19]